tara:strand:+ start:413 stop:1129 length:717 start_codon:yes stop_codon:yes gene_type:complete
MSNKVKGLIGLGVGALVLILVLTLGGKSTEDKILDMEKDVYSLFDKSYTDVKEASTKNDLKDVYKEIIGNILELTPELLSLSQDYIDENYNGDFTEYMKPENQEAEMKKYESLYGKWTTLFFKFTALSSDDSWLEKMESIAETFDEKDIAELINFSFDEGASAVEKIANDEKSLKYFNKMAKEFSKQMMGEDYYQKDFTKEELLSAIKDAKKSFDGFSGSDVEGFMEGLANAFGDYQY